MKQLKFDHQFAQAIAEGSKTTTFRVKDDKDIRVGDIVEVVDKVDKDQPTTWVVSGVLHITDRASKTFKDLSDSQSLQRESFQSYEEMLQTFRRFYGDHINDNTEAILLEFTYEPYETARQYLDNKQSRDVRTHKAVMYADGGSRGNPGPSALGFVVEDEHAVVLHADNKYLGVTTNNQAEYHALIAGLEWCLQHGVTEVDVRLDSMLVVNQLKGQFKVKNRDLWSLYETAHELTKRFASISYTHVPREFNKRADAEVNKALDAVKGSDIVQ